MKATRRKQWSELISFQRASAKLLDATLDMECDVVAEEIEKDSYGICIYNTVSR